MAMKETGKRHGRVLVELGYVEANDLIWAVRLQVEEIILSLFQLEQGDFTFLEGPLHSQEVITLKLSAATLIYNGIKKIHNLLQINHVMPSQEEVLTYSTNPLDLFQNITLNDADKEIFSLVDGNRTIKEIFSMSPLDYFQTMRTLYALLSIRLVETLDRSLPGDASLKEIIEEPEVDIDESFVDKVEDMYDRLAKTDFYHILDVEKKASHDKIKKAYYRIAKVFHPDRHFSLPSEALKNKLHTIFAKITEAYRVLSDQTMRSEYDESLTIKPAKIETTNAEIARVRFEEGKTAMMNRAFADAAELFGQATYLDSSMPSYFFYMGLAYKRLEKFREAEKAVRHALKLDPSNTNYIAELGHIYLKLNLPLRARTIFEKALKFDPSHKSALKGLEQTSDHS
jgi:curved DNA-binding protein CbpA